MRALLTSTTSDRVRAVSGLARRSARRRRGEFVAEGPNAVRAALEHTPAACVELFVVDPHTSEVALAVDAGVPVTPVTEPVMRAMSTTEAPPGVLAVCRPVDVSLAALLADSPRSLMVLAQVRDPGNMGTVIRTADAFGLDGVIISSDSVDVYNPKTVRSTAGSLFHLPVCLDVPVEEILTALGEARVRTLATDPHGTSPVQGIDTSQPHAWVLGNEAWGLPPEHAQACDERRTIVAPGRAESLNLAMAATICAWVSAGHS